MNYSNANQVIAQKSTNWKEQTIQKEVFKFNQFEKKMEKIFIHIMPTTDKQIFFSQNGEIMRVVEGHDFLEKSEMFYNVHQIQNLSWQVQYGKDYKKDSIWKTFWNKKLLEGVGGQSYIIIYNLYYKEGQKQGIWKDLFLNYQDQAQIFEIGEYQNNFRIGKWYSIFQDVKTGGGWYSQNGQKQGQWIDLDEGYYKEKKVTYNGEYNMNGMKQGRWDIMYCKCNDKEFKQIGGGSYDEEGNQRKVGRWVELDEMFYVYKKVTYSNLSKNLKVPLNSNIYSQKFDNQIITNILNFIQKQLYNGEYNRIGIKIGRWDIMYCKWNEKVYKQIGGGTYDQEGDQNNIGQWVELDKGFNIYKQIIFRGEYNLNGIKVGKWDIMYCKYKEKEYKQIGGGSYDQEGKQKKIGKWVELDERFNFIKQVTYNGEYNMNGKKVDRWDTMNCKGDGKEYKIIGGGLYDIEGNEIKIGKWLELDERFTSYYQVKFIGEYNVKGLKQGYWTKMDIEDNQNIRQKKFDN